MTLCNTEERRCASSDRDPVGNSVSGGGSCFQWEMSLNESGDPTMKAEWHDDGGIHRIMDVKRLAPSQRWGISTPVIDRADSDRDCATSFLSREERCSSVLAAVLSPGPQTPCTPGMTCHDHLVQVPSRTLVRARSAWPFSKRSQSFGLGHQELVVYVV